MPCDVRELTVALAGHPPPLVIDGVGEPAQIGLPGTLLGVFESIEINEVAAELHPGQTLLLYTDGVLEAGRSAEPHGERALFDMCRGAQELSLHELLEHIEVTATGRAAGRLHDDIALIGMRIRPN